MSTKPTTTTKQLSINQRRWKKFKSLKRGYYSLLILVFSYLLSFLLPLLISDKALVVHHNGETSFPAFRDFAASLIPFESLKPSTFRSGTEFGQTGNEGDADYRRLDIQYEAAGGDDYVIMPIYPFGPNEDIGVNGNEKFIGPFTADANGFTRIFGTDDRGRDVLARMSYGFGVSISFALLVAILEYLIGIPLGAVMGYFGGKLDVLMQRFIEIWQSLPFLFLIIIVVSIVGPSFMLLVYFLAAFAWIGITTQMRAQFYREKTKDYVAAAVSIGVPTWKILLKHIFPNTLVPIITYFPFAVVASIGALVSLDFLGFGLAPPTPSWGQMIGVGLSNLTKYWLVLVPMGAMFVTLSLVVFIGEGIREAFDPKVFSRLR